MIIKTYEYQKVEISNTEISIPQTPSYFFETGIRRSIRIVPEWTTWKKEAHNKEEELYSLEITCVYLSFECRIEKFTIRLSEIEDLYNKKRSTGLDGDKWDIIHGLINQYFNIRTEKQFKEDLQTAINQLV